MFMPSLFTILSILCAAVYALVYFRAHKKSPIEMLCACTLHLASIVVGLGWYRATGHFGFASALSVTSCLVCIVYMVESRLLPLLQARRGLALAGLVTVMLPLVFPGKIRVVSENSFYLEAHWIFALASYALFACATLHAYLMQRAQTMLRLGKPIETLPVLTFERLMFGFVITGFVLLSLTLLSGYVFFEQLYPHELWLRSHKNIFGLLSWLVFLTLVIGHYAFHWRGRKAVRVLYMGSILLLLSYIGSYFVLEVLLRKVS